MAQDLPKARRVYARPPLNMSDEELEVWAEEFIKTIKGTGEDDTETSQEGQGEQPG